MKLSLGSDQKRLIRYRRQSSNGLSGINWYFTQFVDLAIENEAWLSAGHRPTRQRPRFTHPVGRSVFQACRASLR